MRIASVLTPINELHLKLAAQIGVTDIVGRYPRSSEFEPLHALQKQIESADLQLSVIEGHVPMRQIVLGLDGTDDEIENMQNLIRNMGKLDIPILTYNFMATGDMSRTSFTTSDRGGALVSSFDETNMEDAPPENRATSEELWQRLRNLLEQVIPVAEKSGVKLAMHPDDPPMSRFRGSDQIMSTRADYEKLVDLVESESNGICLCQGCFSEMGEDVPASIRALGQSIVYAHFRDVIGCVPKFQETFHDCGQTDMPETVRAYKEIGFNGPARPDHVPLLEGEDGEATGYSMLGRLFAVGYMRGLIQAVYGS
jgi:mannonate dehydratase